MSTLRTHALLWLALLSGCGGSSTPAGAPEAPPAHHGHQPLFGGTLVELGEHAANLEVLFDGDAGELTFYLLDAHAERAVKGPQVELPFSVTAGDRTFELSAQPEVSELAGNSVGASSRFSVRDERLEGLEHLSLRIPEVQLQGLVFRDVVHSF